MWFYGGFWNKFGNLFGLKIVWDNSLCFFFEGGKREWWKLNLFCVCKLDMSFNWFKCEFEFIGLFLVEKLINWFDCGLNWIIFYEGE